MANRVTIGIVTASIAIALTTGLTTPSMAMSFTDYDGSGTALGSRADVNQLFSGRLTAQERRRAELAEALRDIKNNRTISSSSDAVTDAFGDAQRPISLTLPF